MFEKINEMDLKILEELDLDVRVGSKQIGKKLGIRRQVVDYRIRKMEQDGTILGYRMLPNLRKLGFSHHYRLHIKLKSITPQEKELLVSMLVQNSQIGWISEADGNYDLLISYVAMSNYEFQEIMFSIISQFADFIKSYAPVIILDLPIPERDFLGKKRVRKIKGNMAADCEAIKLTVLDKKIINELAKNARKTVIQIAKTIDEPVEKVNYHLKQILHSGALFSNVLLGYNMFNFELYKTLVYLKNPDRKRVAELRKFCQSLPRIYDFVETVASWQLELDIESSGHLDYYQIMDEVQKRFSDVIDHYDTLYIRRERKFSFAVFEV